MTLGFDSSAGHSSMEGIVASSSKELLCNAADALVMQVEAQYTGNSLGHKAPEQIFNVIGSMIRMIRRLSAALRASQ